MSQRTGRSQEIHHRYTTIYILIAALFLVVALIISLIAVRFNWWTVPAPTPDQGNGPSVPVTQPGQSEKPVESSSPSVPPQSGAASPSLPPAATDYLEYDIDRLYEKHAMSIIDQDHPFYPANAGVMVKPYDDRQGMAVNGLEIQVAPELLTALHGLQADLNNHFADSNEKGRHQLLLLEGYATTLTGFIQCPDSTQTDISCCDHATGYSVDIRFNNEHRGFAYSAEAATYLREVCAKYGLITPDIVGPIKGTDLNAKAWHLRYVGAPFAEYIMENELTMEDFYEDLKGYNYNKRLSFTADATGTAKLYQFYYVEAQLTGTTRIPVSTDEKYTVLPNGDDGYVVVVEVE